MSEEDKVEVETDDDTGAIWNELLETKAGQGDPPAKDEKADDQAEKPASDEAPAAEPPASQEPADDLWKDAPPALREAYEQERKRAEALDVTVKRHSGRLSQLNLEQAALREQLSKAPAKGEEAEGQEERIKQIREEYPDFAPILDQLAATNAEIAALKGAGADQASAQTAEMLREQEAIVTAAHPNYRAETNTPEFVKWFERQVPDVQDGVLRNGENIVNGANAVFYLDLFKRDQASPEKLKAEERRKEQLEAARGVDTRSPAKTAAGADEGDTDGIWNELIDKRRRDEARSMSNRR